MWTWYSRGNIALNNVVIRLSLIESFAVKNVYLLLSFLLCDPFHNHSLLVEQGLNIAILMKWTRFPFNWSVRTSATVLLILLSRKLISIVHVGALEFLLYFFLVYFQFFLNKLIVEFRAFRDRTSTLFLSWSGYIRVSCSSILRKNSSMLATIRICSFL